MLTKRRGKPTLLNRHSSQRFLYTDVLSPSIAAVSLVKKKNAFWEEGKNIIVCLLSIAWITPKLHAGFRSSAYTDYGIRSHTLVYHRLRISRSICVPSSLIFWEKNKQWIIRCFFIGTYFKTMFNQEMTMLDSYDVILVCVIRWSLWDLKLRNPVTGTSFDPFRNYLTLFRDLTFIFRDQQQPHHRFAQPFRSINLLHHHYQFFPKVILGILASFLDCFGLFLNQIKVS